jgi:hypothetical protein
VSLFVYLSLSSPHVCQGLARNDVLTSLNLAVNLQWRFLVCRECEVALPPKQVPKHLEKHHGVMPKKADVKIMTRLQPVLQEFNVSDDLPTLPHGIPHVAGLSLWDGVRCNLCDAVSTTTGSLTTHHWHNAHGGGTYQLPAVFSKVHLQRLHCDRYFSVVVPTAPEADVSDPMARLLEEVQDQVQIPLLEPSERQVSQWLKHTRWHEALAHVPTSRLVDLAEPCTADAFKLVYQSIHRYYQRANELIPETPDLVLQHLHTPDPAKT